MLQRPQLASPLQTQPIKSTQGEYMTDLHLISPEPDRRAFQALRNIQRLHNFKQQHQALQRMQDRLIRELLDREDIQHLDMHGISAVIGAGTAALRSGKSFDDAITVAVTTLEEKPWATC